LALAAVLPEACVHVLHLARSGTDKEARALQAHLTPLAELLGSTYGVPGLKAALNLIGFDVGYPRAPLMSLGEAQIAVLREALNLFQDSQCPS
jgi:4-hydroxy-2-oxoglutarate aldolase